MHPARTASALAILLPATATAADDVDVTPGEFALLAALTSQPGRVFTRDQLLRAVHGLDGYVSRRSVDVHVVQLRKKLEASLIRTVYGVGYSLATT